GTVLVRDINSGSAGSDPSNLTNVNGTLFFTANDGVNGAELWKSDGTADGTTLVKDIYPGQYPYSVYGGAWHYRPNSSSPAGLTNMNGTLFFTANDGVNGAELWNTHGSAAGGTLVNDNRPCSTGFSFPIALMDVNGTLFFTANDGTNGRELWKSDG